MSQTNLQQFNNGFFTMSGVAVALTLFYPFYHPGQIICSKFFKTKNNSNCNC